MGTPPAPAPLSARGRWMMFLPAHSLQTASAALSSPSLLPLRGRLYPPRRGLCWGVSPFCDGEAKAPLVPSQPGGWADQCLTALLHLLPFQFSPTLSLLILRQTELPGNRLSLLREALGVGGPRCARLVRHGTSQPGRGRAAKADTVFSLKGDLQPLLCKGQLELWREQAPIPSHHLE